MKIVAAQATAPESIEPVTGLPRGAIVCVACGVSWRPFTDLNCWCCGQRGMSTAEAAGPLGATTDIRRQTWQHRST